VNSKKKQEKPRGADSWFFTLCNYWKSFKI